MNARVVVGGGGGDGGGEWRGKDPCIQKKMADVFFRFSYNSFTIICSHANFFIPFCFVDRQNT